MTPRKDTAASVSSLAAALDRTGFYPQLVSDALATELEGRQVTAHLIHVDTHFDYDDLHRHITVLALTDDVLAAVHLSDFSLDDKDHQVRAQVSTEVIPLQRVDSVVITTVHAQPQHYRQGDPISEMTLGITWAGGQRLELMPTTCADPECTADHGLSGHLTREDLTIRVAAEAEGQQAVDSALSFARQLRRATVRWAGR